MNSHVLQTAANLAADTSTDLSSVDYAPLVNWPTLRTTTVCSVEMVAALIRYTGIVPGSAAYAALAKCGRHYLRHANYRPAPKTPEYAASAGFTAEPYTPPKRSRKRATADDVAGVTEYVDNAGDIAADNAADTGGDIVADDATVPAGWDSADTSVDDAPAADTADTATITRKRGKRRGR